MKRLLLILFVSISVNAQQKLEVFFDFNKDQPNAESAIHLKNWVESNPKAVIEKVYGYCDSVDNSAYNKDLATRRINSIVQLLRENNIEIAAKVELNPLGKDFKQSKIQSENRKVAIYYREKIIPKPVPEKLSDQMAKAKPGDVIRLANINFFNNSDKIVPKSKPILDELLCVMKENPNLKIDILGHICCKTVGDENGVSTARARAVEVFLIRGGINKKRLSHKGLGTTQPLHPIPEETEEQADENRRVEIKIVQN